MVLVKIIYFRHFFIFDGFTSTTPIGKMECVEVSIVLLLVLCVLLRGIVTLSRTQSTIMFQVGSLYDHPQPQSSN